MQTHKEWSSYKITLILYLIVILLPFGFYFVHTSFKTMQNDTQMVRQSAWLAGTMAYLIVNPDKKQNEKTIQQVDNTLEEISLWTTKNSDSNLYIGEQTLSKDFSQVQSCWSFFKENFSKQHSLQCYEIIDNMAITIEKMVYLKENKIINLFYLSLIVVTLFALLIIYLVRSYIHIQMRKHTIHDHETKLFNKRYLISELKSNCARSVRHLFPLSMTSVSVVNLEKGNRTYDKETKKHILKMLGGLISSVTRASDIACRYDDDLFTIILPITEKNNALILEERIRHVLQRHDFKVSSDLKFHFATTYFNYEETAEAFLLRTKNLLK